MIVSDIVSHLFQPTSFNYILFESVNYLFCVGIAAISYKAKLIKFSHFIIWLILFLSPFFFNYLLFDPRLFTDQFSYSAQVGIFRANGLESFNLEFNSLNDLRSYGLDISSLIFTFSPIPFHLTVTSLAFTNKLLVFFLFIWLYNSSKKDNSVWLFLIPSIILYSSLSLRDPLVIFLSTFFLFFVLKDRYFFSILILFLIALLKFQNALLLFVIYIGKFIFYAHKSYLNLFIFAVGILLIGFVFEDLIVDGLNFFRFAFYLEDIGRSNVSLAQENLITNNETFIEIFLSCLQMLPSFILMPLPFNATGLLQLMQSFENIFLVFLTYYLFKNAYQKEKNLSIFLLMGLLIGFGIYAYVIFNVGTGVRYRFVYLYPFLLTFFYISNLKKTSQ